MRRFVLPSLFAVLAVGLLSVAADEKKDGTVRELTTKDLKPGTDEGKVTEPTKVTSEKELAKAIADADAVAAIAKQVDFTKEYVLVFRWAGSGQDKLTATADKGEKGPVATFTYKRGLTKDLRPHVHLFAVAKDADWKLAE